jgi:tetratricopeptide (TPR) repeat protein
LLRGAQVLVLVLAVALLAFPLLPRGSPATAVTAYQRGLQDLQDQQPRAAIESFTRAIGDDPGNAFAYERRAHAYCEVGEYTRAVADCAEALKGEPALAAAHLTRARAHGARREWEQALGDLDAGLQLRPGDFEAREARAGLRATFRHDCEGAVEDLTIAMRANPGRVTAATFLTRAHYLLGARRLPEALADTGEAIRLEPRMAKAHANRGVILWAMGDRVKAEESLGRAAGLDDSHQASSDALRDNNAPEWIP